MLDIGLDGMDIRRIEAAILNNGSDIDPPFHDSEKKIPRGLEVATW